MENNQTNATNVTNDISIVLIVSRVADADSLEGWDANSLGGC